MGSQGKHRPSTQSHSFKTRAKNRVDDLQGMFCSLQQARKENRGADVSVLEEQVNQMLREWKAELHDATPASSLVVASPSSSELSSEMERLLQLTEEDDDASSNLAACLGKLNDEQQGRSPVPYCSNEVVYSSSFSEIHEQRLEQEMVERLLRAENTLAEPSPVCHDESLTVHQQLRSPSMPVQEPFLQKSLPDGFNCAENVPFSSPIMFAPPEAFLGPKCALWDCPRPAARSEWLMDYCSAFHATLAINEGANGRSPVVRPGGIDLKDGPLFSSLSAKSQTKAVGIPECEGAATSKSPWNAHELFDTSMLPGEMIREWLFFDKPRRAFESGTRKQRSLPDHSGRGWHESRKQILKDLGGLKRSYYMDPQPNPHFEWHLFEYELTDYDSCALYRMELKQVNPSRKSSKSKLQNDSVTALQNQIGRLPANLSGYDGNLWSLANEPAEQKSSKGRVRTAHKANSNGQRNETEVVNNNSFEYMVEDVTNYLLSP